MGKGSRAYADDILIKFYNNEHLKLLIGKIEEWAKINKIDINKGKGKSHIIYFNKKGSPKYMKAISNIHPTLNYKYLGVTMEKNGRFTIEF